MLKKSCPYYEDCEAENDKLMGKESIWMHDCPENRTIKECLRYEEYERNVPISKRTTKEH